MNTIHCETSLKINSSLKNTYKIKEVISFSKLSIVYIGEQTFTGEQVIIKEFYPSDIALRDLDNVTVINRLPSTKSKFEELKAIFLNEALIMKQILHKNIVKYLTHFEENESIYIVMEYYNGIPLDLYINSYNLNDRTKLYDSVFLPLIDALFYMHKKGIIHRDIKPSNIIIDSNKNVYLLDFGSAVFYKTKIKHTILTTSGFSPLEQYSERSRQGIYTDIYSLAATLYYSLTDVIPIDVSKRVIEDKIKNVRVYNKSISLIMSKVIMWGLAVHSKKRCCSLKFIVFAIYVEKLTNKIMSLFKENYSN